MDEGAVFATGSCIRCGDFFSFSPTKVPSVIVDGVREIVCSRCIAIVNPLRTSAGLEPFTVLPGAFEPDRISELE